MRKYLNLRANTALGLIFAFLVNSFGPLPIAQAQEFYLPTPGALVHLSPQFNPPILKGIKVHPANPFRFDFIVDQGDKNVLPTQERQPGDMASAMSPRRLPSKEALDPKAPKVNSLNDDQALRTESIKLIKYFLAALTIPEKDLWVNLSPYEKNRIVPSSFGQTEMGRDLLAEDYMLKQITASLIYPEDELGKKFWKRIYEEAAKKFGTTNIPVNTFNKVWIVPEKAVVYENTKAGTAYVVESKLKVMLEQDYLALEKNKRQPGDMALAVSPRTLPNEIALSVKAPQVNNPTPTKDINTLGSQIIREIVIPELTHEVNEGKNFAQLRQVYNSLILATWYKKKIRDSILEQVYADKKKIAGVGYDSSVIPKSTAIRENTVILSEAKDLNKTNSLIDSSPPAQNDIELIYQRYLQSFKKGAYNFIKEETDPITQETIPRKYFSGGASFVGNIPLEDGTLPDSAQKTDSLKQVTVDFSGLYDKAMRSEKDMRESPDHATPQLLLSASLKYGYIPVSKRIIDMQSSFREADADNLIEWTKIYSTLRKYSNIIKLRNGPFNSWLTLFSKALSNAVPNAIDANYERFDRLRKSDKANFEVPVQISLEGNNLIVSVFDFGDGIPKTILDYWLITKEPKRSTKEGKYILGKVGNGINIILNRARSIGAGVQFRTFSAIENESWILTQESNGQRSLSSNPNPMQGTELRFIIPLRKETGDNAQLSDLATHQSRAHIASSAMKYSFQLQLSRVRNAHQMARDFFDYIKVFSNDTNDRRINNFILDYGVYNADLNEFIKRMQILWNSRKLGIDGESMKEKSGSLFPVFSLIVGHQFDAERVVKLRQLRAWQYEFLSKGELMDQVMSLWLLLVDNVLHMRFYGMHPELDMDGKWINFDLETVFGNKSKGSVGILRKYLDIVKEFDRKGDRGLTVEVFNAKKEIVRVHLRDMLLWGLALALDPSIHDPKILEDLESSREWLKDQGEFDKDDFMKRSMKESLGLLDLKKEDISLIKEALAIDMTGWLAKNISGSPHLAKISNDHLISEFGITNFMRDVFNVLNNKTVKYYNFENPFLENDPDDLYKKIWGERGEKVDEQVGKKTGDRALDNAQLAVSKDDRMTVEEMLNSPGLKNLVQRYPHSRGFVQDFLGSRNPQIRAIFDEVDAMPIKEIRNELAVLQRLPRLDKPFALYTQTPIEELFYFPTEGVTDWGQALSGVNWMLEFEGSELTEYLPRIRAAYMMFRLFAALGQMDVPVFSKDMLDGPESLYAYLIVDESSEKTDEVMPRHYLRMLSITDFLTELLTGNDPRLDDTQDQINKLSAQIKESWKDPSKEDIKVGIYNYVKLMEKLKRENLKWRKFFGNSLQELTSYDDEYPSIGRQRSILFFLKSLIAKDEAMIIKPQTKHTLNRINGPGGIDLRPANMNLQTKIDSSPLAQNDTGGIKFHLNPAMLQQLQNASGFVPVIINIQPMTNLKEFLGVTSEVVIGKMNSPNPSL